MDYFILVFLILLNGIFSMSEIALVSARKARLENEAEKGDKSAKNALSLANDPELFLSAVQIGITLISILTGVYSGDKFAKYLQPYLEEIAFIKPYAQTAATIIIVVLVTYLSIVFGELIPKRIGLVQSERIAKIVAGPMRAFANLFLPFVWLLNITSNFFFKIFKIKSKRDDHITEEEIKTMIVEGTESGAIEEAEQQIIERVFHLGDRNITSLMTHRSDIIWFNLHDTEDKIKEKILQEPHSLYPICDGSIDELKGVVSIKDLYIQPDSVMFKDIMKPALFIPENNSPYQVLEKFKQSGIHCAFLVDEYGTILGMITINDILEAIVGDLPQDDFEDYEIIKREDGTYIVDAQIPFYDFLTYFERTEWMNEGEHDFDTMAGFVLNELERIPKTGDRVDWKGFSIEIVDMDGHRIDKLIVSISDDIKEHMTEE